MIGERHPCSQATDKTVQVYQLLRQHGIKSTKVHQWS